MKKNGGRIDIIRFGQRGKIPVGDIGQIPDRIKNRVSVGACVYIKEEPYRRWNDIRYLNSERRAFNILDQLQIIHDLLRITRKALKAFAVRFNYILR